MNHIILFVQNDRSRQESFKKLRVDAFQGKVVFFPLGKPRQTGHACLNIGYFEGGRNKIVYFSVTLMHVYFFRDGKRSKYTCMLAGRLALSEEEIAAAFQCGMKNSK